MTTQINGVPTMSPAAYMPIVFMVLLLAALILKLLKSPVVPREDGRKSTLAKDGGLGGVGFLIPSSQRVAAAALRAGKPKT